jgi:hypothetical protein
MPQFYVDYPQSDCDIIHNQDSKDLIVQCYSDDLSVVIPISINFKANDTVSLAFSGEFSGTVTLTKATNTTNSFLSGGTEEIINHGIGTKYLIVQSRNSSDSVVYESDINLIDDNNLNLKFSSNKNNLTNCYVIPESTYTQNLSAME